MVGQTVICWQAGPVLWMPLAGVGNQNMVGLLFLPFFFIACSPFVQGQLVPGSQWLGVGTVCYAAGRDGMWGQGRWE